LLVAACGAYNSWQTSQTANRLDTIANAQNNFVTKGDLQSFGNGLSNQITSAVASMLPGNGGSNPNSGGNPTPIPTAAPTSAPTQAPASAMPSAGAVAQCPDVTEASTLIAGDPAALVREGGRNLPGEEPCLFETRTNFTEGGTVTCPDGWACELDTVGPNGYYYFGGNGSYQIDAGSFRLQAAYPVDDPIQDPCSALANSLDFLIFEGADPNFQLLPGNFGPCTNLPSQPPHSNTCPNTAADVVAALGGSSANEWTRLNDGQWKRNSSVKANLSAPFGTLDWWDGHNAHMGTTQAQGAFEATWNCNASE
jgi:hypothetical protein